MSTIHYEFSAFSESGFLSEFSFTDLKAAQDRAAELMRFYERKVARRLVAWRRMKRRGASDHALAWGPGINRPSINEYKPIVIYKVTRTPVAHAPVPKPKKRRK